MPYGYSYSTPVRAKTSGLFSGLFGLLGANGAEVTPDQIAAQEFRSENPDVPFSPTFVKVKNPAANVFSGGAGTHAANVINAEGYSMADRYRMQTAYDELRRQRELEDIGKEASAKLLAESKATPTWGYLNPGDVPFSYTGDPTQLTPAGTPFDISTASGKIAANKLLSSRLSDADNIMRARELGGINVLAQKGIIPEASNVLNYDLATSKPLTEQVSTGAALGSEENLNKLAAEKAYPTYETERRRQSTALIQSQLDKPEVTPLNKGINLVDGQVVNVVETIDPKSGQPVFKSYDSSGREFVGRIPRSKLASPIGARVLAPTGAEQKPNFPLNLNLQGGYLSSDAGPTPSIQIPKKQSQTIPESDIEADRLRLLRAEREQVQKKLASNPLDVDAANRLNQIDVLLRAAAAR